MYKKFQEFILQPYPLFLEASKLLPAITATSIFLVLFLLLFEPFGLANMDFEGKTWHLLGYGPLIFIVLSVNYFGITRLFPKIFQEDKWVIWKESSWILFNMFAGCFAGIIYQVMNPHLDASFSELFVRLIQAFWIAVIPESIYVLSTYMIYLNNRLQQAEAINRKLLAAARLTQRQTDGPSPVAPSAATATARQYQISTTDHSREENTLTGSATDSEGHLSLVGENNTERIEVPLDQLLYIQSQDNYSSIACAARAGVKHLLLRSSLKRLEQQIDIPFVIRCHRSFIVNLSKVQSVEGNARGYRLSLESGEEAIPVSRESGKEVLNTLERLAG